MANYAGNLVFQGLGTFTLFTAPTAGNYFVELKSSIPTLSAGGGQSALVIVIKNGASTVYTGTAGAQGARIDLVLAAADVISTILSSANANDNALNAIKTEVAFGEGL